MSVSRPKCLVVGLDGSEASRRAMAWAAMLANALGARLVAVHAVGLLEGAGLAPDFDPAPVLAELGAHPVAEAVAEPGPPDQVLLRAAERYDADLIVVGHRGIGGSRRVLGSTSEEVLAAAHRPVVVVPVR